MPKLPVISGDRLTELLEQEGFRVVRRKGGSESVRYYLHPLILMGALYGRHQIDSL